jgi:carbonic anhydrase/acetyltransferase-like protein (isoleucine patch superfamily)
MILSSGTKKPKIHSSAYVAPSAILSGDVTIGAGCAVLHGAVITAEGAPVEIGEGCVVMEHAVLRGSGGEVLHFPLKIGKNCIFGPHTYVVGATIGNGCFVATGAKVFNGAILESNCSVALSGIVHVKSRLKAGTRVPIEHVAHGDPATVYPPDRAVEVHEKIDFWRDVFNIEPGDDARARAAEVYSKFLRKTHAQDAALDAHVNKAPPRRSASEEPPQQQMTEVDTVVDAMMLELQEMEHRRQESLKKRKPGGP